MKNAGTPLGQFDFRRGAMRGTSIVLYASGLVHQGVHHIDFVALHAIAAARVAYVRDERKIGWGVVLAVLALALYAASGPLAGLAARAASEVASSLRSDVPPAAQGVAHTLHAVFLFLEAIAETLPVASGALTLWAVGLAGYGAYGSTILELTLGAAERVYAVPGRDTRLFDFAELLAEALARVPSP